MFFSIIIPVYNVAPYLRECLDSVVAQTFGDWEAICVDDGSTDGSGAILDEYAAKDNRFKVIHQPNAGVSAARNAALDVAKGKWICFVDADDKVGSNWLQYIVYGAERHPEVDWIRTSYRDLLDDGRRVKIWPEGSARKYPEWLYTDVAVVVWNMLAHAALLVINIFKRKHIDGLRFDVQLKYCEDSCFVLDYMNKSSDHVMLTITNDEYLYRMRETSASHTMKFRDVVDSLGAVLLRWRMKKGSRGVFSPAIDRYFFRCVHMGRAISREEGLQFRRFLWRAWLCGFFSPFYFDGFSKRGRWLLFVLLGNLRILLEKAGFRWLLPYRER